MADFYAQYPASSGGSANLSVGVNGDPIPADSTLIGGKNTTGNLTPVIVTDLGEVKISAAALPLPAGAATSANQSTEIASLSSIDTKLSSQATASNQSTQITSLSSIDTKLSSQATASKQDTLANKSASSDVHEAYDYRAFTYVAATQKIDTIVYKTGGSGGTTVATQTFGYDGSDRLTSITKT